MMLKITLNKIRENNPCESGWVKLLKHLNKTKADDEELTFKTILESNGLDDALWCLRYVNGHDREIRLYAVWCARQVEHLDKSGISKNTNDVSERYANGRAATEELAAARAAAARAAATWAAAWAATEELADAWDTARAAARAAAWAATEELADAWDAAAWDAARAAAWAAQKEQFIKQFCTED